MTRPLVEVGRLRVVLAVSETDIVDEVSFTIGAGEVLGLVGESGSGKTTVGLSMLDHCRRGARIGGGSVRIGGEEMLGSAPAALRKARGRLVAYVPQDPGTALNPALRVGEQLQEGLAAHLPQMNKAARDNRVQEMLREVRLPSEPDVLQRYPHQFSGGQQQRIALAMAFSCRPRLIVLDEPTTGLDVTTQAHVLETVRALCREHGVAALYVSHDLAVVASLADRIAIMYAGRVVEHGRAASVFGMPAHPYTRRLLQAVPDPAGRRGILGIPGFAPSPVRRPSGCFFAPRCDLAVSQCTQAFPPETQAHPDHGVRCWRAESVVTQNAEPARVSAETAPAATPLLSVDALDASYGLVAVLRGIAFEVGARECVALVGESGSGKTTLARCIAGLHDRHTGQIRFRGQALAHGLRERGQEQRRAIQYVFQNPYASLNPRRNIGDSIARPLHIFFNLSTAEIRGRVGHYLERVSLSPAMAGHFPDQLSGGERQRVAVARALAAEPDLLVCDEITSALDVSVQAAIVELLADLRRTMGLSLLFVTHNLALIRTIADRVAVMSGGQIVEAGPTRRMFEAPEAGYTRELLANTPGFDIQEMGATKARGGPAKEQALS